MPTRRDCLSAALAAAALGALGPAAASETAASRFASGAAPVPPGAAKARAYLAGGWVLTAEDLARLGPAAPPAIPLA